MAVGGLGTVAPLLTLLRRPLALLPRLLYLMLCRSIQLLALLARGDAAKELEILVLRPGTVGQERLWASRRQALWLVAGRIAVSGEQRDPAAGSVTRTPAGVAIIDTRR
jgi:hypothetical protein